MISNLFTLFAVSFTSLAVFGQGRLIFNNSEYTFGPSPVTIGSVCAAGEGPIGAYVGADYTASLYYPQAPDTPQPHSTAATR